MLYKIKCQNPRHAQRSSVEGWTDEVLATTDKKPQRKKYVCKGCRNQDIKENLKPPRRPSIAEKIEDLIARVKRLEEQQS